MIQLFKSINGYEIIKWERELINAPYINFVGPSSGIRGHKFRLERDSYPSANSNDFCHYVTIRHNFLTNRAVPTWNSLNDYVMESKSLNSFKARLDEWFEETNEGCL